MSAASLRSSSSGADHFKVAVSAITSWWSFDLHCQAAGAVDFRASMEMSRRSSSFFVAASNRFSTESPLVTVARQHVHSAGLACFNGERPSRDQGRQRKGLSAHPPPGGLASASLARRVLHLARAAASPPTA